MCTLLSERDSKTRVKESERRDRRSTDSYSHIQRFSLPWTLSAQQLATRPQLLLPLPLPLLLPLLFMSFVMFLQIFLCKQSLLFVFLSLVELVLCALRSAHALIARQLRADNFIVSLRLLRIDVDSRSSLRAADVNVCVWIAWIVLSHS